MDKREKEEFFGGTDKPDSSVILATGENYVRFGARFPCASDASLILIYRSIDDCSNQENGPDLRRKVAARRSATADSLFV